MRKPKSTATTVTSSSRRTDSAVNRRPAARRIFEGVIAGYLHDISQRHRHTAPGRSTPPAVVTAS
jgi:hypothetical protein